LGQLVTNTGEFEISRAVAAASSLQVRLSVGGTASNGIDYFGLPAFVTIPANSNSVSLAIVPTGDMLAADPSTVVVGLLPDPAYQLGSSTNATVILSQYEKFPSTVPLPALTLNLFVGTNLDGQLFVVQSSTNLIDWSTVGTEEDIWGVVTIVETNQSCFQQRFFRAIPLGSE
jgi:hypothetical protein